MANIDMYHHIRDLTHVRILKILDPQFASLMYKYYTALDYFTAYYYFPVSYYFG